MSDPPSNASGAKIWRWAVLFSLFLFSFNSPFGECSANVATGFPLAHTRTLPQATDIVFVYAPIGTWLIDLSACILLGIACHLLLTRLSVNHLILFRGSRAAIVYCFLSSLLCWGLLVVDKIWRAEGISESLKKHLFDFLFGIAVWFYYPFMLISQWLRPREIENLTVILSERQAVRDSSEIFIARALLLPTIFIWALFFSAVAALLFHWRQRRQNKSRLSD